MSSDPLLEQLADHLRAIDATSDTPLLESTQQEIREVAFGEEPTLYAADFSPGERASGPQPAFDAEFVRDREPVVDPVEAAVLGVEAIRSGSELEREPTLYAAAIVLKTGRPAVDVLDDSFVVPGPPWAGLADHRATISKRLPSIGRIRSASAAYGNVAGTGFLVGPGLLMTNRHVADYFALGAGREGLVLLAEEGASCDLAAEAGSLREVLLEIDEPVLLPP
ncbi:MAG: hypothetical protein MI919_24205 [Holophagales bacterium]|nr:hypothetical protein [Holophagales bacterium]